MNILKFTGKFYRFTTGIFTLYARQFRIYDCGMRGYVIMTAGKVIGTADNIVQAQQLAINYRGE